MSERNRRKPEDVYGLSESEQLFDRISHKHFIAILEDISTNIHEMQVTSNNYGEFLFVTTSRQLDSEVYRLTFWGLGFHEYRERWLTEEWYLYISYANPKTDQVTLTKEQAQELLKQRQEEIAPDIKSHTQSRRGQLFEILADLTDEDGAYSELEDLGGLLDDFFDDK